MNAANQYRAKAWECLATAEMINDPVDRAEILRFARMWMDLAEPMNDMLSLGAMASRFRPLHRDRWQGGWHGGHGPVRLRTTQGSQIAPIGEIHGEGVFGFAGGRS